MKDQEITFWGFADNNTEGGCQVAIKQQTVKETSFEGCYCPSSGEGSDANQSDG